MQLKDLVQSLPAEWVEIENRYAHRRHATELYGSYLQVGLWYVRRMRLGHRLSNREIRFIGERMLSGHQVIVYRDGETWKVDNYTRKRAQDHQLHWIVRKGCEPELKAPRKPVYKPRTESAKAIFEMCKGRRTVKKPNLTVGSVLPNGKLTWMGTLSMRDHQREKTSKWGIIIG